jgi:hypothetical protein
MNCRGRRKSNVNWVGRSEEQLWILRARGGVVVKALRYKPAGRGFDSDGVIGIFQVT